MSRIVPNIELQGQASNPGGPNEWAAGENIVTAVRRGVLTNAQPLAVGSPSKIAVATAIETRTSTTVVANSTQLAVPLPGPGTYKFKVVAFSYFTTAVTDGFTGNVNYSGSFTAVGSYVTGYLMNGTTTTTGVQPAEIAAAATTVIAGLTLATYGASVAAATPAVHVLEGTLIATASGTLAFAFAQDVSGVDTTNLGVGSTLEVIRVA
jgi:hypothetical protein